jgi:hypothetical protein
MPKRRSFHEHPSDPVDAAAFRCKRFWVPRGTAPDLSDDGYLVDPESPHSIDRGASAVPFEALAGFPVLGLLGEPGMGKSTVLNQEARRLAPPQENGDRLLRVDLAACGTDVLVSQRIFQSKEIKSWKKSKNRLHLLLDGFDTCLQYVENLVALLLERLYDQPRNRLSLRIACRTTDWPADLETGLEDLWREQEQAVGIYELTPLRQKDVRALAEASGPSAAAFLSEVANLGAAQFANRPITLRFLLNSFRAGKGLPPRRTDLYREGCLVLCDECRDDLRRRKQVTILKTAYRRAPARFRELLGRFIDSQNQRAGDVLILDRLAPVWDRKIANLLRRKLMDTHLAPQAFRRILTVLIRAGGEDAWRIATDLVGAARNAPPAEMAKPIEAALELLVSNPSAGWQAVWPVAKARYEFAEYVIGCLARDPYSSVTTRVLEGLSEDALADLQIWLFQHHPRREGDGVPGEESRKAGQFTLIRSNDKWHWLGIALVNNLIQRGTSAAIKAIRKIKEAFPDENLDRVEKVADELRREKTWTPLPPSDLLALILDRVRQEVRATAPPPAKKRGRPAKIEASKKRAALAAKESGATGKEVAKILYGVTYPTTQQVKNAPNILNYYKHSTERPPNKC